MGRRTAQEPRHWQSTSGLLPQDTDVPTTNYIQSQSDGNLKYADYQAQDNHQAQHNDDNDDSVQVYIVRQEYGYLAIAFSIVQTIILALMMWQCGVAPMKLKYVCLLFVCCGF